jgi:predicted MPP superfamily phosphohydrolase
LRILLLIAAGCSLWAAALWLGTERVALRRIAVPSEALSAALGDGRVLHVSDLHVRRVGYRERRLAELAATAAPDLVAVTGDLVEPPGRGRPAEIGPAVAVMRRLAEIAPTVAVLGNNDLPYPEKAQTVDTQRLVAALADAGVLVLRNAAARMTVRGRSGTSEVYIVGVDDNFTHRDDLHAALGAVPPDVPAILLAHSPDVVADWDVSRFALVLAGHTHGGQIRLPFIGALETQTRVPGYVDGLYALPWGNWLHVSGGVGTSEIHLRFLAPPGAAVLSFPGGNTGRPPRP